MASGQENGQFQVQYSDQRGNNPQTIFSASTVEISGGAKAAPTGETRKAIPNTSEGVIVQASTRGRVNVVFVADATDIVESEESQWEIPGVLLNEATGVVAENITLTQENMTGFTQAGTVDVTATASTPVRLAYWDVPRGLLFALDPNKKVRAYIGDDA